MPSHQIPPQGHLNFPGYAAARSINVSRYEPFGAAPFTVRSGAGVLGAGSCPALTARPPYITVPIPAGTPFQVQNLSPGVTIQVDD